MFGLERTPLQELYSKSRLSRESGLRTKRFRQIQINRKGLLRVVYQGWREGGVAAAPGLNELPPGSGCATLKILLEPE